MKVSLPLQALHASYLGSGTFEKRGLQLPLRYPLKNGDPTMQEGHPVVVIGDALNWCHTAQIMIGSPPQTFNAVLDISSSDLMIPSPLSRRTHPPPLHSYHSSQSSTYEPNGTQVTSNPLGLRTSGFLSKDSFHISNLTVKGQTFEEYTFIDFDDCSYCNWNFDTVLPLGLFNASSPRNFMSPIALLTSQNLLDENIFSLRLSRKVEDGVGQLVLGGRVDPSFTEGPEIIIPTTDLIDEWAEAGLWKSTANSFTLGDKSQIHYVFKQPTIVVFHTTFFWMVLPSKLSKKLNKAIGAKYWGPFAFVDCDRRPQMPDLTIVLADREFLLTPYDYIVEQNESGRISCLSSFWAGFDDDGVILLGSAFLKAWVTVWDWEHRTIGFTKAVHII